MTLDGAYVALYGMRPEPVEGPLAVYRIVSDVKCSLRKHGIEIETLARDSAWRIDAANKRKLQALVAE